MTAGLYHTLSLHTVHASLTRRGRHDALGGCRSRFRFKVKSAAVPGADEMMSVQVSPHERGALMWAPGWKPDHASSVEDDKRARMAWVIGDAGA